MKDFQVEGPYRLCGYSFGGSIAWEMAKQLQAKGESVELLLAFDTIARGMEFFQLRHEGGYRQRLKQKWSRAFAYRDSYKRYGAHLSLRHVGSLIRIKLAYLFKRPSSDGSGSGEDIQAYAEELEETVQNPLRAVYDYGTYDGELILLRAERQLVLRRELDYELGWTGRALQGLRIIDVPGDHLTLMYGEPGEAIAKETMALLDALPAQKENSDKADLKVETVPFSESSISSPVDRFRQVVKQAGNRNAILDLGQFYTFRELGRLFRCNL